MPITSTALWIIYHVIVRRYELTGYISVSLRLVSLIIYVIPFTYISGISTIFACFCTNWSTRSWVQAMIYNSQISYYKCLIWVMFLITCLYLCFFHVSLLRKSWSTIRCLTATLWCYAMGHISQPGLFSISIRRLLVRSREVLKPWDW